MEPRYKTLGLCKSIVSRQVYYFLTLVSSASKVGLNIMIRICRTILYIHKYIYICCNCPFADLVHLCIIRSFFCGEASGSSSAFGSNHACGAIGAGNGAMDCHIISESGRGCAAVGVMVCIPCRKPASLLFHAFGTHVYALLSFLCLHCFLFP